MSPKLKAQYDEEPPPPYMSIPGASVDTAASSSYARNARDASSPEVISSSLFSEQLSSLRERILQEQAARSSMRDQRDYQTLSLLAPCVEELLHLIARINPPPDLVEATFVPDEAVDKSWRHSDSERRRSGHVVRLIKVGRHTPKTGGDGKQPLVTHSLSATSDEDDNACDGWGRRRKAGASDEFHSEAESWWADEGMARRLARHLQPNRAASSVDRQIVQARVGRGDKEVKKAYRWSFFKKDGPSARGLAVVPNPPPCETTTTARSQTTSDGVSMTVNAEETTFRRRNEMGIWESKTGWGLVVRVRIRA